MRLFSKIKNEKNYDLKEFRLQKLKRSLTKNKITFIIESIWFIQKNQSLVKYVFRFRKEYILFIILGIKLIQTSMILKDSLVLISVIRNIKIYGLSFVTSHFYHPVLHNVKLNTCRTRIRILKHLMKLNFLITGLNQMMNCIFRSTVLMKQLPIYFPMQAINNLQCRSYVTLWSITYVIFN